MVKTKINKKINNNLICRLFLLHFADISCRTVYLNCTVQSSCHFNIIVQTDKTQNHLHFLQIYLITGDVTSKEDVERIVSSTVSHFGKLDILVCGYQQITFVGYIWYTLRTIL